jgi:hypothetical protein
MAAGLENTALIASWGDAMPTPPMALEMGPTPMRLSPLVARERAGTNPTLARINKDKSRLIAASREDFILIVPYPGRVYFVKKKIAICSKKFNRH